MGIYDRANSHMVGTSAEVGGEIGFQEQKLFQFLHIQELSGVFSFTVNDTFKASIQTTFF